MRNTNNAKKVNQKDSKHKIDWKSAHRGAWKEAKKTLPQTRSGKSVKPSFHIEFRLTPRETDVLKLNMARNQKDYAYSSVVFVDVSQSHLPCSALREHFAHDLASWQDASREDDDHGILSTPQSQQNPACGAVDVRN